MNEADFQLFETVGALVMVVDLDGNIVYWNHPCSQLTGYALAEVRGRPCWDFLLLPGDVERERAAFTEPAPARPAGSYWVTKTGERRWITWSQTTVTDADGRAQYVVKTGVDGTEDKLGEDRLFEIIDISGEAIISVDDAQTIVRFNHAAETIFGWTAAEVIGKPLDMLLPERVRAEHHDYVRGFAGGDIAAKQLGANRPEISGLRKNGEEFPAQAGICKLAIDGNTLSTVVLRDITEQRRREQQRELLAEMSVVAARAVTTDYDVILSRIAALAVRGLADCCLLLGFDRGGDARRLEIVHRDPTQTKRCEILQRPFVDLVGSVLDSGQTRFVAEMSAQYLESITHDPEELRALQELAPRSLIVVPLMQQRKPLGVLSFVALSPSRPYGVDELCFAEEFAMRAALALENSGLFEENRRVTRDMREANEQMVGTTIRAQESMEAAEWARAETEERERQLNEVAELRETFIGIVGHDLRNPLASIGVSAAVLLRDGHLDARGEKAVARITSSSLRMSRMLAQLLDLTRARLGGGFPIERVPTDLRDVCRSVVEEFASPIQLEIVGDVAGSWDPDRLEEALSNLVGNAVEYAASGSTVRVVARPGEAGQVVVEVRNEGEPIPAHVLPTLFEPFRRGKPNEPSAGGNLGLGLYIAKQIVLAHGGTLDARSADGTTIFAMCLPRWAPERKLGASIVGDDAARSLR
jgi:PAS domain S-box-containing protein